ncbi:MAG: pitrilysin family protein [Pseudomonadota bacterium]
MHGSIRCDGLRYVAAALAIILMAQVNALAGEDKLTQFRLDNGLDVLVKEDHSRKVAALQLWVKVGSADEGATERGISHLIEHMAFKGTERRGVGAIAAEVEALGGDINAYTSWDETVFHVTVPASAVDRGLDILLDAVLNPVIDEKELDKEKQVVLEEILEGSERPATKSFELLFDTAYTTGAYKHPIIGYKEIVEKFSRDDIVAFRKKWYVPENMFLLIVGDVDPGRVRPEVERLTAGLTARGFFRPPRPQEPVQREIRSSLIRDDNARETWLNLAFHIPSVKANDVNALDLTGDILGGRENSRLVRVLKKEMGLVNSISAYALTPRDPGLMVISATLDAKNLKSVTRIVMEQIALQAGQPPSAADLEQAKIHIESQHVYARETVEGIARSIGDFNADLDDPFYEEKYLKLNADVTGEQISRVTAKYLRVPNVTVSVLIPQEDAKDLRIEDLTEIIGSFGGQAAVKSAHTESENETLVDTLSNGIKIVLVSDDSNPVVSFRIAHLGGKRFEDKENEGIMNFIAAMLDKGAAGMTEEDILAKVDSMGGRLSGFSGYDSLGLSANFFSRYIEEGLGLLAQIHTGPSFPEDKVERERELIINKIETEPDRPVAYAVTKLVREVFPRHPYGFDQEGTLETVAAITREDLRRVYERCSVPSNTVISGVGKMDLRQTRDLIEKLFGKIPAQDLDRPDVPSEEPLSGVREKVIRIPRAKAHIAVGFRGTTLSEEDRYAMDVLNNILAGQGGRLFVELRDGQSLAYIVTSFVRPGLDPGIFAFYMACDASKTDQALAGLFQEIKKIRESQIPEKELQHSITNLAGNHLIALQSSWSRAENRALNVLYGLGYDYDAEYIERIRRVTAKEVLDAARKYLDADKCAVVKIVPEDKKQ